MVKVVSRPVRVGYCVVQGEKADRRLEKAFELIFSKCLELGDPKMKLKVERGRPVKAKPSLADYD